MKDLAIHGITPSKNVYWDLTTGVLYEHTLEQGLGQIAHKGALVVDTTPYTGRSPKDKFVVREAASEDEIWWGDVNHPMEPEVFDALYNRVTDFLGEQDLYVQDLYAGADWCESLFARGLIKQADLAILQAARRTGNLSWALREMADSNRRRLAYRLQALMHLLFPPVILAAGLVVMFFVVSLFIPLISLIQTLT